MLLIAIGVAVVLLIIAVPQFRRAALSLLGLLAIIAIGSGVFAAAIWGIYQAKPLLTSAEPTRSHRAAAPEDEVAVGAEKTAESDLAAAVAEEDEQALEDEKQRLEEKKRRIELMAARARVILEEDRKLAEQAATFPLPVGTDERLGDIMAIRIPAWRDKDVASAQKEAIRTWLQSIGLTAEETANIVTAKAWGSLYDMWVSENSAAAPAGTQQKENDAALVPPEAEPRPELESEVEPELESDAESEPEPESPFSEEIAQDPPSFVEEIPLRREVTRSQRPRRFDVPRRPPPVRRPPPRERQVGPFGY